MTTSLNYITLHCINVLSRYIIINQYKTIHTKYYDCVCIFALITWLSNLIFVKPYSMYLEHQFYFMCLSHTSARWQHKCL